MVNLRNTGNFTGALLTREGAARLMVEAMQRHPLNVRMQVPFFFSTLVTGPRRSSGLQLNDPPAQRQDAGALSTSPYMYPLVFAIHEYIYE